MSRSVTRRRFLRTTSVAALSTAAATGAAAPSDTLSLGFIGVGPMGSGHLKRYVDFKDTRVTAVCDADQRKVDAAVKNAKGTATGYRDFRKLLERKDIDAVVVATPPHWHAIQAVAVCEAGKELFVEKPMTLTVAESQAVCRAAKKNKTVTQVGTQIHATENYRRVVEIVRSGILGKINAVRTFFKLGQKRSGLGKAADTTPPAAIDWDMWVGPAPMRPYNPLITSGAYNHCSFMSFSGGWLPGMAPHIVDLPIWALELGQPSRVNCTGGRFVLEDIGDAPDVQEAHIQYPNLTMTWMMNLTNSYGWDFQGGGGRNRRLGVYFHGDAATLFCDYGMHKIIPEGDPKTELSLPPITLPRSKGHYREWIDCIKIGKQPSCNVFYHHKVNVPLCLANLSLSLGRSIQFDPEKEEVIGDAEAAQGLEPRYRAPWRLEA